MTDATRTPEDQSTLVVADRVNGMPYTEIAVKHGIHPGTARRICKRALQRAEVTLAQIGASSRFGKPAVPPMSKEQYDKKWIARVKRHIVIDENGCWIWQGQKKHNGYGQVDYRGKTISVHRQMFQVTRGIVLPKKPQVSVCHSCDVRPCCNPDHLWAGSQKENLADSVRKGRHQEISKTECERGHPFTPENTLVASGREGRGARHCKTCQRARARIASGWPEDLAYSLPKVPAGFTKEHICQTL